MNIKVGILGDARGWHLILGQEGIPYETVNGELTPENYSAVVASDDADDRECEMLRQYLQLGGSVLCSSTVYARIRQSTYQQTLIRYLLPDADSAFADVGLIDVRARCRLAWNANELKTDAGVYSAHMGRHEAGNIVALPFDPSTVAFDFRSSFKSFYSPEDRLPFERVSFYNKSNIRRLVARSLESLHHARGLPFVHWWYFPKNAPSVGILRVDTDEGTPDEIRQLHALAKELKVPMTWFVDVENQEPSLETFKWMDSQEVGLHCYEHKVHEGYASAERDMKLGLTRLKEVNIQAAGYAAPYGRWDADVGRAVQNLGFEYSSEFSYDYDNLPSFPLLHGEASKAVQIPVHPICIGSLKRQGYFSEQMKSYFRYVVEEKLAAGEPLAFYHHPKDGNPEVLRSVVDAVRDRHVEFLTMKAFGGWWKKRSETSADVEYSNRTLALGNLKTAADAWVEITLADGNETIVPPRSIIAIDSIHWERRINRRKIPHDYARCRRFNYRVPLTRGVDGLMGLLKRTKGGMSG